jgi:hypothetical protein
VTELCDIDDDEFYILEGILSVTIDKPDGKVLVYLLYANAPPPDGRLEDADYEDESDYYDWYTIKRALHVLKQKNDIFSINAMQVRVRMGLGLKLR